MAYLSSETMEARRQWKVTIKVLKLGKKLVKEEFHIHQTTLQNKGEIKTH